MAVMYKAEGVDDTSFSWWKIKAEYFLETQKHKV